MASLVGRARNQDLAVFDRNVRGVGVEDVPSDELHFVAEDGRSLPRSAAADDTLATAGSSRTEAATRTVAFEHGDVLVRHTELIGDHLCHGALRAVTLRVRAHQRRHLARGLDTNMRELSRHGGDAAGSTCRLDVNSDTEAEISTFLAL